VLQCVAVCCSVLQCVAVIDFRHTTHHCALTKQVSYVVNRSLSHAQTHPVLSFVCDRVVVCCSVLHCWDALTKPITLAYSKWSVFSFFFSFHTHTRSSHRHVEWPEYSLFDRAILQKSPIILRSLLISTMGWLLIVGSLKL